MIRTGKFITKRQFQCDVIENWISKGKNYSITKLAKKLGCSRTTTYKLIQQYEENTILNNHKNTGKTKRNEEDAKKIKDLYLDYCKKIKEYRQDDTFLPNFKNFNDFVLKDIFFYSTRTIYNYLIDGLIFSPDSKKSTKRKIRKLIKEKEKSKLDILKVIDINNEEIKKIKPYKNKTNGIFGDVVEIDACQHRWFNGEKCHIYAAVDRKSGYLLTSHILKKKKQQKDIIFF